MTHDDRSAEPKEVDGRTGLEIRQQRATGRLALQHLQARVDSSDPGSGAGRAGLRDNNVRDNDSLGRKGAETRFGGARKEFTAASVLIRDGEMAALRIHVIHTACATVGDCN